MKPLPSSAPVSKRLESHVEINRSISSSVRSTATTIIEPAHVASHRTLQEKIVRVGDLLNLLQGNLANMPDLVSMLHEKPSDSNGASIVDKLTKELRVVEKFYAQTISLLLPLQEILKDVSGHGAQNFSPLPSKNQELASGQRSDVSVSRQTKKRPSISAHAPLVKSDLPSEDVIQITGFSVEESLNQMTMAIDSPLSPIVVPSELEITRSQHPLRNVNSNLAKPERPIHSLITPQSSISTHTSPDSTFNHPPINYGPSISNHNGQSPKFNFVPNNHDLPSISPIHQHHQSPLSPTSTLQSDLMENEEIDYNELFSISNDSNDLPASHKICSEVEKLLWRIDRKRQQCQKKMRSTVTRVMSSPLSSSNLSTRLASPTTSPRQFKNSPVVRFHPNSRVILLMFQALKKFSPLGRHQAAALIQKSIRGYLTRTCYKQAIVRKMVVTEMMDTELSYVRGLLCIYKVGSGG